MPPTLFNAGPAQGSSKLMVFHRRAAAASADALASALHALWAPLLARPDHGITRVVRNTVLGPPRP